MQVQVHINLNSEEEFADFCRTFGKMAVVPLTSKREAKDVGPEKEPARTTAATKPTMNEKLAIKAAKEALAETEQPAAPIEAVEPTFDNVKTKVLAVAKKTKSKDAALAILQKYDAATVVALDQKHYAAVIEDCDVLLAA